MAGPRVGMTKEHQPPDVDSDPDQMPVAVESFCILALLLIAMKGWGLPLEQALMFVGGGCIIWRWLSQVPAPEPLAQTSGYAWNLPHPGLTRPPAPQGSGGDIDRAMALMRAKIAEAQAAQPFYGMMNCPPPRDEGSIAPF